MELRQLRYLVALAEERNFTRAAARSHVAQSALSQQVRKLERELGVALVDRTTRRVALTAAGQRLTVRARRVLAELDDARAELAELTGLTTGSVTVGVTQTPGPFDTVALLAGFHARYPGIELAMREQVSIALAEQLRADELDVAFLSLVEEDDLAGLAAVPLAAEELVVAVADGHRLAGRRRVAIGDLRDEQQVAFARAGTVQRGVRAAARAAGFEPRVAFETREVARARAIAAAGLAVAVLPRSDALRPGPAVRVIALAPPIHHRISIAWRRGKRHAPAAAMLIEQARALYDGDSGHHRWGTAMKGRR